MCRTQQVQEAISCLGELGEEVGVSKKFKEGSDAVIKILAETSELAIEKALFALEELNSSDLPSYHRTQIWDVISLLESTKSF